MKCLKSLLFCIFFSISAHATECTISAYEANGSLAAQMNLVTQHSSSIASWLERTGNPFSNAYLNIYHQDDGNADWFLMYLGPYYDRNCFALRGPFRIDKNQPLEITMGNIKIIFRCYSQFQDLRKGILLKTNSLATLNVENFTVTPKGSILNASFFSMKESVFSPSLSPMRENLLDSLFLEKDPFPSEFLSLLNNPTVELDSPSALIYLTSPLQPDSDQRNFSLDNNENDSLSTPTESTELSSTPETSSDESGGTSHSEFSDSPPPKRRVIGTALIHA